MKTKFFITILITGFIALSFTLKSPFQNKPKPWTVPEAAKNKKNPVKADDQTLATGKVLWTKHCKSCHGAKGLGDGSKAAQLDTEAGNFSLTTTQSQSDGSLFYKASEGRDDMPKFTKKIPDEDDRWALVNYIRTFKK